jgi:ferritin-like metal-binding protein YciE
MQMNSLKDLYLHELKDLYSAESQIAEALPKMAEASKNQILRDAFSRHLEVTRHQKNRLEQIFQKLGERPEASKCEGIKGIIKEGESMIKQDKSIFRSNVDDDVLDAALIAAAQRVEHYEISAYGTVRAYAERLGFPEQAALLQQTLDEESATDRELTQLAESFINIEALK